MSSITNRIVDRSTPVPVTLHSDGSSARSDSRLLLSATVCTGLMAGFFYAYSCSVMIGLAHADDATFISAMQTINANIRNIWFGPVYFGTAMLTVGAAMFAYARKHPRRRFVLAGALLYLTTFIVTVAFAIPLNEQLAAAGPVADITDTAAVRAAYEHPWVRWNVARTLLNTAAMITLARALHAGDAATRRNATDGVSTTWRTINSKPEL